MPRTRPEPRDSPLTDCAPDTATVETVRARLLVWFDDEHRALPWRTQPSPYGTVVSEFMLQQTQVATVIPYYHAFLKRFPDFAALAAAPEDEVLRAWSGLGYYRRARMLKRAAEVIVRRHGGELPHDPAALRALPGFGEYTVGAVGSIALGLPLPLVDGNVRRVVGRLCAMTGELNAGAGKRQLWATCAALVDPARPGDFNQALMELGATVCRPREPLCLACPLFEVCRGRQLGDPERFPAPLKRRAAVAVREVAVALFKGEKVLVLRRGEGGAFAGMWELPRMDSREAPAEALTPARVVFDLVRLRTRGRASRLGATTSTFTHHRIATDLFRISAAEQATVRRQRHIAHQWVEPAKLLELPASRAQRKLFEIVAADRHDTAGEAKAVKRV